MVKSERPMWTSRRSNNSAVSRLAAATAHDASDTTSPARGHPARAMPSWSQHLRRRASGTTPRREQVTAPMRPKPRCLTVNHDNVNQQGGCREEALQRVPAMNRRSYVPFILASVAALVVGLALGKGRGDEHSLINTTSAVLLTVGFLAVVVFAALEVVSRVRN